MTHMDQAAVTPAASPWWGILRRYGIYIFMICWSVLGLFFTDYNALRSVQFWEVTTVIFAGIAIWKAFSQGGEGRRMLALKQVAHWGAFLVAMFLLHSKQVTNVLTGDALSLVMLLLLALATFLDGLYVDWRFCIVGLVLAAGVLLLAALSNAVIALIILGVAALLVLYLFRRFDRDEAEVTASASPPAA
jgi:hypothetical protein